MCTRVWPARESPCGLCWACGRGHCMRVFGARGAVGGLGGGGSLGGVRGDGGCRRRTGAADGDWEVCLSPWGTPRTFVCWRSHALDVLGGGGGCVCAGVTLPGCGREDMGVGGGALVSMGLGIQAGAARVGQAGAARKKKRGCVALSWACRVREGKGVGVGGGIRTWLGKWCAVVMEGEGEGAPGLRETYTHAHTDARSGSRSKVVGARHLPSRPSPRPPMPLPRPTTLPTHAGLCSGEQSCVCLGARWVRAGLCGGPPRAREGQGQRGEGTMTCMRSWWGWPLALLLSPPPGSALPHHCALDVYPACSPEGAHTGACGCVCGGCAERGGLRAVSFNRQLPAPPTTPLPTAPPHPAQPPHLRLRPLPPPPSHATYPIMHLSHAR